MKWISRTLVQNPLCVALCLNERDFNRQLKKMDIPPDQFPVFVEADIAATCVHFISRRDRARRYAIVCVGDMSKFDEIQVACLLVHEAVHIWQEARRLIAEVSPSDEFEAYSIQSISQDLMDAYVGMLKS